MKANLSQMAEPALIAVVAIIILAFVRGIILRLATRWAGRTETRIDDIVIDAIRVPSLYWCAAIGLYTGVVLSDLDGKYVGHLSTVIYVIVIISVTITLANLAGRKYLVQHELRKRIFRRFREEGIEIPFPQRTVHIREEKK